MLFDLMASMDQHIGRHHKYGKANSAARYGIYDSLEGTTASELCKQRSLCAVNRHTGGGEADHLGSGNNSLPFFVEVNHIRNRGRKTIKCKGR